MQQVNLYLPDCIDISLDISSTILSRPLTRFSKLLMPSCEPPMKSCNGKEVTYLLRVKLLQSESLYRFKKKQNSTCNMFIMWVCCLSKCNNCLCKGGQSPLLSDDASAWITSVSSASNALAKSPKCRCLGCAPAILHKPFGRLLDTEALASDSSSVFEFDEFFCLEGRITSTGISPESPFSSFWKNSGLRSLPVNLGAFFLKKRTAFEMESELLLKSSEEPCITGSVSPFVSNVHCSDDTSFWSTDVPDSPFPAMFFQTFSASDKLSLTGFICKTKQI